MCRKKERKKLKKELSNRTGSMIISFKKGKDRYYIYKKKDQDMLLDAMYSDKFDDVVKDITDGTD